MAERTTGVLAVAAVAALWGALFIGLAVSPVIRLSDSIHTESAAGPITIAATALPRQSATPAGGRLFSTVRAHPWRTGLILWAIAVIPGTLLIGACLGINDRPAQRRPGRRRRGPRTCSEDRPAEQRHESRP
jgi:hypothetical protein